MDKQINNLIERLNSSQLSKQIDIVKALASSENSKAVKPLINLLERSLGNFHKRILVVVIIEALGKLGAKEAREVLTKALDDNTIWIKQAAVKALKKIEP